MCVVKKVFKRYERFDSLIVYVVNRSSSFGKASYVK